ncbi:MAG: hypothetical protein JXJ20_03175 [Anaerolineae bacterium]|nr:hypothetical protein [Anaerolineae bacterium]
MNKRLGVALLIAFMLATTLACGFCNKVADLVDTIDDAVQLLEEIEQSGTWQYITDGLDGLADQEAGYEALVTLREGPVNAAGEYEGALSQDLAISMQVDPGGDALAQIRVEDRIEDYFIAHNPDPDEESDVYRVDDGRYFCVNNNDDGALIRDGLNSVFAEYALSAAGVQLLSVANEEGEAVIADRTTTHYELESKVREALDILGRFDNDDLQEKINEAGEFEMSGDLYIDQDTDALLRFDSVYHNLDKQRRTEFTFEVTQWGGVADITMPADVEVADPCE